MECAECRPQFRRGHNRYESDEFRYEPCDWDSRLVALLVRGTGMYQGASRRAVKQPFENGVGKKQVTLDVFMGYGVHWQMYHRIDRFGQELLMSGK